MSLDERLRADLERAASGIVVDVERNLDVVEARVRGRGSVAPLLLAAAAVVVVAIALRFGAFLPSSGGPGTSPAASTASPYPCPSRKGPCLGPLQPGTYSTRSFKPQMRYRVDTGWSNTLDNVTQVDLTYLPGGTYTYPDGSVFHDAISVFRRPVAESTTAQVPLAGIGRKALDLATWLDSHVDLDASGLSPVTIGGAPGYRIDIALPSGPRTSPDHCTTDLGETRCESLFISDNQANQYGFGIVGPETAVIYLLDLPTGDTVMIVIDDVDGVDAAGLVAAATPVVESLTFGP